MSIQRLWISLALLASLASGTAIAQASASFTVGATVTNPCIQRVGISIDGGGPFAAITCQNQTQPSVRFVTGYIRVGKNGEGRFIEQTDVATTKQRQSETQFKYEASGEAVLTRHWLVSVDF